MFYIRHDSGSGPEVLQLGSTLPSPTEVEYPEGRQFELMNTQDGKPLIQRPIRDSRIRQWIWRGYTHAVPSYDTMYSNILDMETKTRLDNGWSATVEIWEDESGEGGFDETTDGLDPDLIAFTNLDWTRVKFTNVYRVSRKGGGRVIYDQTIMEFVLAPVLERSLENTAFDLTGATTLTADGVVE